MGLNEANIGQEVVFERIEQNTELELKLSSLGLLPGDQLIVTGKAPFKGPISVKHGNQTFFAIRFTEAKSILVSSRGLS